MSAFFAQFAYLAGAALFIFSLHWMNDPKTARKGVFAGVAGMTLAILGTLLRPDIVHWEWLAIAAANTLPIPYRLVKLDEAHW